MDYWTAYIVFGVVFVVGAVGYWVASTGLRATGDDTDQVTQ